MEEEDREALPLQNFLGYQLLYMAESMPSPFPPLGLSEEAPLSWPLPGLTVRRFTTAAKSENVILLWFWDETLFSESFFDDLKENGRIIVNSADKEFYAKYDSKRITVVDASSVALEILGKPITNTAMLGALVAVSDIVDLEAVEKGMAVFLKGELLKKNIEVVQRTFLQCREAVS